MNAEIYTLTARALCYPEASTLENARALKNELARVDSKYEELLTPFVDYLENQSREQLEEAYTNTFDIQAVCPLEVGYALFGEDYKRGEFLVRMHDLHNEHGTSLISSELGDYLPNILMLLAKMPEGGLKKDFIEKLLLPSLEKMLRNFDDSKGVNPFSRPMRAVSAVLARNYTMNPKILEVKYE